MADEIPVNAPDDTSNTTSDIIGSGSDSVGGSDNNHHHHQHSNNNNNNSSNHSDSDATELTPDCSPATRRRNPFILLPLYIYPGIGVWEPLFNALEANPGLDFWVIVNPFNGPGQGTLPDANYLDMLSRLTGVPNVKVIGYVRCDYARRPVEDIVADIEKYAAWENEMVKQGDERTIIVDGIFIDETPQGTEFIEYLTNLSNTAKTLLDRTILKPVEDATTATAARKQKEEADTGDIKEAVVVEGHDEETRTCPKDAPAAATVSSSAPVIYNPGVVVDPAFYRTADYIVVYENPVSLWDDKWVRAGFDRLLPPLRARSIIIAHSAEGEDGVVDITNKTLEEGFLGQFITTTPGYESWCPFWGEYCADLARRCLD